MLEFCEMKFVRLQLTGSCMGLQTTQGSGPPNLHFKHCVTVTDLNLSELPQIIEYIITED